MGNLSNKASFYNTHYSDFDADAFSGKFVSSSPVDLKIPVDNPTVSQVDTDVLDTSMFSETEAVPSPTLPEPTYDIYEGSQLPIPVSSASEPSHGIRAEGPDSVDTAIPAPVGPAPSYGPNSGFDSVPETNIAPIAGPAPVDASPENMRTIPSFDSYDLLTDEVGAFGELYETTGTSKSPFILDNNSEYYSVISEELKKMGLGESDIDRLLSGQISLDELFVEIISDPNDRSRYQRLMEAENLRGYYFDSQTAQDRLDYLKERKKTIEGKVREARLNEDSNSALTLQQVIDQIDDQIISYTSMIESYGGVDFHFSSMDELETAIAEKNERVKTLLKQLERAQIDAKQNEAITILLNRLLSGESLDSILSAGLGYRYTDAEGNQGITFDSGYASYYSSFGPIEWFSIEDLYGDNETVQYIKNALKDYEYGTPEYSDAAFELFLESEDPNSVNFSQIDVEDFETAIRSELYELGKELNVYNGIHDRIEQDIQYYFKFLDPSVIQDDYEEKSVFDGDFSKVHFRFFDDLYDELCNAQWNDPSITDEQQKEMYEEYTGRVLSYIINSSTNRDDPNYATDDFAAFFPYPDVPLLGITSTYKENAFDMCEKWRKVMTEGEKDVFNYKCQAEGYAAAYRYLCDMIPYLDKRYVQAERNKDAEYAHDQPFWASLGSVFVKPIEGIGGVMYSINCFLHDVKIRLSNTYSTADTWRATVSNDIRILYGDTAAFFYNTGMSMSDTGLVITLTALTGGTGSFFFSSAVMGSSVYLSTLNDALERGLDDNKAIALALCCASVESLMEGYSVGHLLGLEKEFGEVLANGKIMSKIIEKLTNAGVNSELAKNIMAIAYSTFSQSLIEGDEEFCTEILDYLLDVVISGDFSNRELEAEQYRKEHPGCSEAEVAAYSLNNLMAELKDAWLGGVASGAFFGLGKGAKTAAHYNTMYRMYQEHMQQMLQQSIFGPSFKNGSDYHLSFDSSNNILVNWSSYAAYKQANAQSIQTTVDALDSLQKDSMDDYTGESNYLSYKTMNGIIRNLLFRYNAAGEITSAVLYGIYSDPQVINIKDYLLYMTQSSDLVDLLETNREEIFALDEALRNSHLPYPMVTYRGLSSMDSFSRIFGFDPTGLTNEQIRTLVLAKGGFSTNGFFSTSVTPKADPVNGAPVIYELRNNTGVPALDCSKLGGIPSEQEVLIASHVPYKYVDVRFENGQIVIVCEVDENFDPDQSKKLFRDMVDQRINDMMGPASKAPTHAEIMKAMLPSYQSSTEYQNASSYFTVDDLVADMNKLKSNPPTAAQLSAVMLKHLDSIENNPFASDYALYDAYLTMTGIELDPTTLSVALTEVINTHQQLREQISKAAEQEIKQMLQDHFGYDDVKASAIALEFKEKILGSNFVSGGIGPTIDWKGAMDLLENEFKNKTQEEFLKGGKPVLWSGFSGWEQHQAMDNLYITIANTTIGEMPFLESVFSNWNSNLLAYKAQDLWAMLSTIYAQSVCEMEDANGESLEEITFLYPDGASPSASLGDLFRTRELPEIVSYDTIHTITMARTDPNTMEIIDTVDIDISDLCAYWDLHYAGGEAHEDTKLCDDIFKMFEQKVKEAFGE